MSERNCGTCAHWERPRSGRAKAVYAWPDYTRDNYEDPVPQWVTDKYEQAKQADALFGDCKGVAVGEADVDKPLPLALVLDAEEYFAALFTRAEFTCALWEQRKP